MYKTARTLIHPLRKEDLPHVLKMYQELDSNRYIGPLRDKDPSYYQTFLERKLAENKDDPGFLAVYEQKTPNRFIGTINVNLFQALQIPQVGAHLSRKYWNKGYASELMHFMLDHAKRVKKWSEVHGVFESDHVVSKSLLEKLYFEPKERTEVQGVSIEIYSKSL